MNGAIPPRWVSAAWYNMPREVPSYALPYPRYFQSSPASSRERGNGVLCWFMAAEEKPAPTNITTLFRERCLIRYSSSPCLNPDFHRDANLVGRRPLQGRYNAPQEGG